LKFLFVLDPLASLKAYKDTSVAIMRAAQARGHRVFSCTQGDLFWQDRVFAFARELSLGANDDDWVQAGEPKQTALASFDAVLNRKDPPFDLEYLSASWLLTQAERDGARRGEIVREPLGLTEDDIAVKLVDYLREEARDEGRLEEADVIVAGGRGLGGAARRH